MKHNLWFLLHTERVHVVGVERVTVYCWANRFYTRPALISFLFTNIISGQKRLLYSCKHRTTASDSGVSPSVDRVIPSSTRRLSACHVQRKFQIGRGWYYAELSLAQHRIRPAPIGLSGHTQRAVFVIRLAWISLVYIQATNGVLTPGRAETKKILASRAEAPVLQSMDQPVQVVMQASNRVCIASGETSNQSRP